MNKGVVPLLESGIQLVCALDIDMIGSTDLGFRLLSDELFYFNQVFVEQIRPHLEALDLVTGSLKFTGDGWLLMLEAAKQQSVASVVCLALIQANVFRKEMAEKLTSRVEIIPRLRLSVCCIMGSGLES